MSNYLYFFKSFKNDKSIYKKVIILSIAIILLIIVFSFTKSMNMYIENGIKQDLSYKTLYIDTDFNTNSISLINKIKEIKHVSDAFRVLGVEKGKVNMKIAKLCYKKAAMKHHPDKGGSVEKMQEINKAYDIIKEYFRRNK